MKLTFLNLYPAETMARYQLSSYVLKAYLQKYYPANNDLSIDILNFSNRTEVSEIQEKIIKNNPDLIGYSCYIWNIEKILKIIQNLKNKTKFIHILGGPEISLNWVLSLSVPSLGDYYVIGEGERKLLYLIRFLEANRKGFKAEFPKGIAFWENGNLNYVEDTDYIKNLDEIPSIYLNGVIEERLYAQQQAFLETQRGCKWRCKYCVYPKNLPSLTFYSLGRIFQEIDYLIIEKRIDALRIFDAMFTFNSQRSKEIVKHLIELKNRGGLRLPWIYWEFTYQHVDEEFVKLTAALKYREKINNSEDIIPQDRPQLYSDILKDYTAINVMGIQSFCQQALKAVGRPSINVEQFDTFMNMVRKYNIVLKIDLILGLPFETFDSYLTGLEFLLSYFKNTDHILNIHRLQVLPGSEMENLCEMYGIHYSTQAPHLAFSTQTFSVNEMARASKLSAILFRMLNSPLRMRFFEAKDRSGEKFVQLVENILNEIIVSDRFNKTRIVLNEYVDDGYWNDEIYREIPSQWFVDFLESYGR